MISALMVEGPILVKAKKIGESEDGYYLEFQLNETQKIQFIAELLLAHTVNGSLVTGVVSESESIKKIKLLKETMKEYPDMSEKLKDNFLTEILKLSKE